MCIQNLPDYPLVDNDCLYPGDLLPVDHQLHMLADYRDGEHDQPATMIEKAYEIALVSYLVLQMVRVASILTGLV